MTGTEQKEMIVATYHCNDIHAETCVDTCTTCERYLRNDLDALEKKLEQTRRLRFLRSIR